MRLTARLALIFLALTCLCVQAAASPPKRGAAYGPPDYSIGLAFSADEGFPLESIELSVAAPDGNVGWKFKAAGREEIDALIKREVLQPAGWYTSPGTYTLRVVYRIEGAAGTDEQQEFTADGSESRIWSGLRFVEEKKTRRAFLASAKTTRILHAPRGVWLVKKWSPAPDEQPLYEIINSLTQPLYGVSWRGNFFGHVSKETDGKWEPYVRGGFCGTVGAGKPIRPGGKGESIEGYFLSEVKPFVKGKYRYVVRYAFSPHSFGTPASYAEHGLTYKLVREIYEVVDEFQIDSDAR